MEFLNL